MSPLTHAPQNEERARTLNGVYENHSSSYCSPYVMQDRLSNRSSMSTLKANKLHSAPLDSDMHDDESLFEQYCNNTDEYWNGEVIKSP